MIKLAPLYCLLCFVVNLSAQDVPKTYTVTVKKLTTSFENILPDPIPEFNIPNYQRVASNGSYQLNIEFTQELVTKQLITRKDASGAFYNKLFYVSPAYNLKITDLEGNLVFISDYGSTKESMDWGKSQKFTDSDATYKAWRTARDKVWKDLELKAIDWTKMKADMLTFFNGLGLTNEIVAVDDNEEEDDPTSEEDDPVADNNVDTPETDAPKPAVDDSASAANDSNSSNPDGQIQPPITTRNNVKAQKKRSTNITKLVGSVIN